MSELEPQRCPECAHGLGNHNADGCFVPECPCDRGYVPTRGGS